VWQDVLDSDVHHAYFKKFLDFHQTERPWSFYLDVEELDKINDPAKRRKKISNIMQSYFGKESKFSSPMLKLFSDISFIFGSGNGSLIATSFLFLLPDFFRKFPVIRS